MGDFISKAFGLDDDDDSSDKPGKKSSGKPHIPGGSGKPIQGITGKPKTGGKCTNYDDCLKLCSGFHLSNKFPPGYKKHKPTNEEIAAVEKKCSKGDKGKPPPGDKKTSGKPQKGGSSKPAKVVTPHKEPKPEKKKRQLPSTKAGSVKPPKPPKPGSSKPGGKDAKCLETQGLIEICKKEIQANYGISDRSGNDGADSGNLGVIICGVIAVILLIGIAVAYFFFCGKGKGAKGTRSKSSKKKKSSIRKSGLKSNRRSSLKGSKSKRGKSKAGSSKNKRSSHKSKRSSRMSKRSRKSKAGSRKSKSAKSSKKR